MSSSNGIEQLGRPDDVVVTAQVLELLCERTARDGGEDLARRVAASAADTVVDEGDPRTGRRFARTAVNEDGLRHLRPIAHLRQATA
jgi:hypothetical protein